MDARPSAGRVARCVLLVVLGLSAALAGCEKQRGEGPGGRIQRLALQPEQEAELGDQAFHETLKKAGEARLVTDQRLARVKDVGKRIEKAAGIEPLRREINLHIDDKFMKWEYAVIDEDKVNAFCLPGGKVVVYTGLLRVADSDDELAAVMGHEAGHALAHHASERIAEHQMREHAIEAANRGLGRMNDSARKLLVGLLSAGAAVRGLSYDRAQETEADHIGLILMTFAGYNPDRAVTFWEKMEKRSTGQREPPEILSTHPHHAQRLAQIERWLPGVKGAYRAYTKGKDVTSGGNGDPGWADRNNEPIARIRYPSRGE